MISMIPLLLSSYSHTFGCIVETAIANKLPWSLLIVKFPNEIAVIAGLPYQTSSPTLSRRAEAPLFPLASLQYFLKSTSVTVMVHPSGALILPS